MKDALELPDDLRIPLHSLQADAGYLIGRVAVDVSTCPLVLQSLETRLSQVAEAAYRLNSNCADMLEALRRVDHTVSLHGKMDSLTDLHKFVQDTIAMVEGRPL